MDDGVDENLTPNDDDDDDDNDDILQVDLAGHRHAIFLSPLINHKNVSFDIQEVDHIKRK